MSPGSLDFSVSYPFPRLESRYRRIPEYLLAQSLDCKLIWRIPALKRRATGLVFMCLLALTFVWTW